MMKIQQLPTLLLAFSLLAAGFSVGAVASPCLVPPAPHPLRIVVIPKGTTHSFWTTIHSGALRAKRDLERKGVTVEIIWKVPEKEYDRDSQIDLVESFITQKVDGIVLAPMERQALIRPVEDAATAGIPLVLIDSDVDTDKRLSLIGTDNRKGGYLAGRKLAALLGGRGRVLMMRYMLNSTATEERERGFLEAMRSFPRIRIISKDQYGGATEMMAQINAENLLSRYGKRVDGIFTSNQSTTSGMLRALEATGRAGKVKFIGFDPSAALLEALSRHRISGLVIQNPFLMGYDSVLAVVKAIRKQPVPKRIDTGVTLITAVWLRRHGFDLRFNPSMAQYHPLSPTSIRVHPR